MNALATTGLTVRYGGVLANDAVSLHVGEGEVVGLIGPNGAGKTTFVDAVTGFTPPPAPSAWPGGASTGCRRTGAASPAWPAPGRPASCSPT